MSIMPDFDQLGRAFAAETHTERAEMPELAPPEPGIIEPHDYGPPKTVVRESNYISDESLLLWLAEKTEGKYGELRDAMDMSRTRSKLMEDLGHIKSMADRGASNEEIANELASLLEAYRGTELEQELYEFAAPLVNEDLAPQTIDEAIVSIFGGGLGQMTDEELAAVFQNKIDALGRDDQLALVTIQSLTADIREAQQLASNLMSSSNQASNAIIGNIAR
jgi:hypothetical protein